jgi:hypothetical protein
MRISRFSALVAVGVVSWSCSGVSVRKTETPEGMAYDLACARGDQCVQKAQRICKHGYRFLQRSDPDNSSDGRHHWTIACGESQVAQPPQEMAQTMRGSSAEAPASGYAQAPLRADGQVRSTLSLQQAKETSVRLEPGMTREAVSDLFGPPAMTQARTTGGDTGAPSQGLVWTYQWWVDHPPECRAGAWCRGRAEKFDLIFQQVEKPDEPSGDTWRLHSWSWRER